MADIRRDENKRESWLVKNNTKNNIAIGDLLLLPVFKPGCTIDVLKFYSREKISHSRNLASLLKSGKFTLNKKKIYTNSFPGNVTVDKIDEALTPAEENEVTDVSDQLIEEVTPGQEITDDTGGILLHGIDLDGTAQPIHIIGAHNDFLSTSNPVLECLLEDILKELIRANLQMSLITGVEVKDEEVEIVGKD